MKGVGMCVDVRKNDGTYRDVRKGMEMCGDVRKGVSNYI